MYKYLWHALLINAALIVCYFAETGAAIASEPVPSGSASASQEQSPNSDGLEVTPSPLIDSVANVVVDAALDSTTAPADANLESTPAFAPEAVAAEAGHEELDASWSTEAIDAQQIEGIERGGEVEEAIADFFLSFPASAQASESTAAATEQGAMSQVTSVSQLSDVEPTDWAFQALQSLVERYGCIAGYPDGTYRGNRPLTRYEFAAGLNACLDRVNELIAAGLADAVTAEELAVLQRLQEEFAAELATLRGRVDALEARTAELEANQFSTTTKLSGLVWFNVTGAFADGDVLVETTDVNAPFVLRPAGRDVLTGEPTTAEIDSDPEIAFSNLGWISLITSFTGRDSLVTQLAFGNGNSPANAFASAGLYNTFGVPFTDQTAGVDVGEADIILREMFYSFPVGDDVQLVVGPRINWYRYFDSNNFTFFLTGAGSFNSSGSTLLNSLDRGSGLVALWQINDQFRFGAAYLGENTEFLPGGLFNSASDPDKGLFGGTNSITAELTYSPSPTFNVRLLYNRSRLDDVFGQVGGALGEPIYGFADDGSGGPLDSAYADVVNLNFDWLITSGFGVFGRYTYGNTNLNPGDGEIESQAFQAGLAFPDLGKEGALATVSYLIPFSVLDGREFLVSGGGDGGVQYEFEATYFYPLNDNLALVPAFYVIGNANNFDENPTIFVGNMRAQFSF